MTKAKLYMLVALMGLFGAKALGQEWESSFDYSMNDSLCYSYQDAIELADGCFVVATSFYYKSGYGDLYSAQPAIAKFSANGEELGRTDYFRPGYDGGALFISKSTNLDNWRQCWETVTKFPAEAFVGIDEAHDNGLKVAVAYPNPGKDVLNIRTGLRDAWVEVYDLNGRLVHRQDITENVTGIEATDWAEGVYVWKVMAGGKEAESGKWIKE